MRPDRDVSHRGGSFPYLPDGSPFRLNGVVFDFDGTLTLPGMLDFAAIHDAVGSPRDVGLLEFLAALEDLEERGRKEAVLHAAEMEAAGRAQENEGASELVSFLRERGIPMAIITRNSRAAVERAMARLPGIALGDFALVVSRDLPLNPKPFPDGVEFAARELGVESAGLLMIGDHAFDIEAGKRAGTLTMFLRNDPRETRSTGDAHFVVDT
ncbi:MAG: HAD-IA family hydrolase, partial [Actinobacteria bacterium]|nr:HAD-IA family hydrolase [Actinomycetota bacterium]